MLVSAVIQEVIDEAVIDLTPAGMLVYFKSGLRQMAALIKYRGFLTEGTLSVAANAQTASLLSLTYGFIRERNVWYVSGGERIPIVHPSSSNWFHNNYTSIGIGKPETYLIEGTTIKFDRPVDEALTIGIYYFKEISAVALTDTFLGDERIIQASKHLCLSRYYRIYEEDKVKSDDERLDAATILSKIQEDYEEQEMSGNVEITEVDGL